VTRADLEQDGHWVSVKQYAENQSVHERTVRRWIRDGHVTAQRHGTKGQWRILLPRISKAC
jgi:excisionase family DNA binding protein